MSLDLTKFNVYVVGGAVRDTLFEKQVKDLDYVVVGASSKDMIAAGFQQVGSGFPIYLHPISGDEYALARTEVKTGVGYYAFDTETQNVSLEEDLSRRDVRCNALAVKIEDWDKFVETKDTSFVIDYFGGIDNLNNQLLQHINEDFGLDPVRVLRTARFAARYNFKVHPDTIELMRKVAPELMYVPQERIWAEFEKGLMEKNPVKMFSVLNKCGALHIPALQPYAAPQLTALMKAANDNEPLFVRFALVSWGFEDDDYENCRIPVEETKVSKMLFKYSGELMAYSNLAVNERLDVLESFRALNDFKLMYACFRVLDYLHFDNMYQQVNVFLFTKDLENLKKVDTATIANTCKNGAEIKRKLREARLAVM